MNLVKKHLVAILLIVLLLSACSPEKKESDKYQNDVSASEDEGHGAGEQSDNQQIASDNMQAINRLKAVMTGDEDFFETGLEQQLNINELNKVVSSDSAITAEVKEYTVVDLDTDGIDEIVLWLSANGDDNYGCEILRYHDAEVYGYLMWYRAFNSLKSDGTFSFSGGAADTGFGKLIFDGKGFRTERIVYSKSDYGSDNEIVVSFFANDEEATQSLFETELQKQSEKKDAVRCEFTVANIETLMEE